MPWGKRGSDAISQPRRGLFDGAEAARRYVHLQSAQVLPVFVLTLSGTLKLAGGDSITALTIWLVSWTSAWACQEHAVMHGQEHPDPIGQPVIQPDQRHLHQIGGGALHHGIDGVTASLSRVGRQ